MVGVKEEFGRSRSSRRLSVQQQKVRTYRSEEVVVRSRRKYSIRRTRWWKARAWLG
jgi:hypothetical protein